MFWQHLLWGIVAFITVCVVGTFIEYLVHVLMHRRLLNGKIHTIHHKNGLGQGVWGEFLAYFLPAMPVPILVTIACYFGSLWSYCIGFWIGYVFICFVCAYCHQASHEHPELIFWMPQPQHHVHHRDDMWFHNYGVSSDLWDRLFGTYLKVEYTTPKKMTQLRPRDFFQLKWF
jgi:sterol desaturase/sphingolipid hydroxylase (fatty acid hydroxylase superfamily)